MLKELDWIVVPGGPGISKCYLEYGLKDAFAGYKLHYYDVLGAPESSNRNPLLADMVNQIPQVAAKYGLKKFGLVTHSFSAYLGLKNIEMGCPNIQAMILLTPLPFQFSVCQKILEDLHKKVTPHDRNEAQRLSQRLEDGAALFRLFFPYYLGDNKVTLPIDVPFDTKACYSGQAQLPHYDFRELVQSCPIPLVRIVGERDPFFTDRDILLDKTIVMPGIGHYPFFEDNDAFIEAIKKADQILSQHRCTE